MSIKTKVINPREWRTGEAGIGIQNLLYHVDRCLKERRMTVADTERFIKMNVICNRDSVLKLATIPGNPGILTLLYRVYDSKDYDYVGFSSPINGLYTLLCTLKQEEIKRDQQEKEQAPPHC